MSEPVTVMSRTSEPLAAALALPSGSAPTPAVVVLHEYWGLTDHIRARADAWAGAGFVALAADFYRGARPSAAVAFARAQTQRANT